MYYIAFLRAINVGRRRVKMDALATQFEALGYTNIHTYIASGNVIFQTPDTNPAQLETDIEQKLNDGLGFEVATMIRTAAELQQLASHNPFPDFPDEKTTRYIFFLKTEPLPEHTAAIHTLANEVDLLHLDGRHLHWLRRRDLGESQLSNNTIEKALKCSGTNRNINTVQKIVKKYFSA